MNTDDIRKMLTEEGPALLAKIKANHAKLDSCLRHSFKLPELPWSVRMKATCVNCGGEMDMQSIRWYVAGYNAAGGNPTDIAEGLA